jgi:hypothetical protein
VVTLVTGVDYVVRAVRMSKTPRDKQADAKAVVTRAGTVSPGNTPDPDGPYPPMPAQAGPDRKTRDRIRPALRRLKLRG